MFDLSFGLGGGFVGFLEDIVDGVVVGVEADDGGFTFLIVI